jgi:hypothetical protein
MSADVLGRPPYRPNFHLWAQNLGTCCSVGWVVDKSCDLQSPCDGVRSEGWVFHVLTWAISAAFRSRAQVISKHLCARQQLSMLQRMSPQPRLRNADRAFRFGEPMARQLAQFAPNC